MAITETQSYDNFGGQGKRQNLFTITTTGSITDNPYKAFDGDTGSRFYFNAGQAAGECSLVVAFVGKARIIDGFTFVGQNGNNELWDWQGWDGSAWVSIANWNLGTSPVVVTSANTTAYTKYRWINLAVNSDPNWNELNFSIEGNSYEHGDRTSSITVTSDLNVSGGAGGDVQNCVNGVENHDAANDAFVNDSNQTGKMIQFVFAENVVLTAAYWCNQNSVTGNNGTWKWQRSDDTGSTWVDVSSPIEWEYDQFTSPPHPFLFDLGNTTPSTYYRMLQTSGVTSNAGWMEEALFDISAGSIGPPTPTPGLKTVRILASGATGPFENVNVLAGATGPTGLFEHCNQTDSDDRTFATVRDAGPSSNLRTIIVDGFTAPSS